MLSLNETKFHLHGRVLMALLEGRLLTAAAIRWAPPAFRERRSYGEESVHSTEKI